MARASIPDIARLAGVSTATVDRALNGRRGVSAANRQRVLTVARDLGYLPQDGMTILPSRPARLAFFIPAEQSAFMEDMIASIESVAASLPLVRSCSITRLRGIEPADLSSALDALNLETQGVGLVATDAKANRDAVDSLRGAGISVVAMLSDLPHTKRNAYIGIDNRIAGRTAAEIISLALPPESGSVAVFLGSSNYHGHEDRLTGFREATMQMRPDLHILNPIATGDDSTVAYAETKRLLTAANVPAAIYCIGAGRKGVAKALALHSAEKRPVVVMHDLTRGTAQWLDKGIITAVIDQNAQFIGEQAVIKLLGSIASSASFLPTRPIEPRIVLRSNVPAAFR